MTITLAIPALFDAVAARFALDGTNVPLYFGWREHQRQQQGDSRIVCYPGDSNGDMGETLPPRSPGFGNPRPLLNLAELCTWEITGTAPTPTASDDERAQYQATREIYDAWARAVYLAAHGTYEQLSAEWLVERKERRRGATLRVVLAVQAVVPDAPVPIAPIDTSAGLTVDLLNVTESISITPA